MKYRIATWAAAGFLVASGWAVYFFLKDKDVPIEPLVSALLRLSCPIAIVGMHYPVSIYSSLAANVATYAVVGLLAETLRRQLNVLNRLNVASRLLPVDVRPTGNSKLAKGEPLMFGPIEVLVVKATPEMLHNWGWFLAFGIVLLLLGIAAIVRSFAATVASMVFFGWLLVFGSAIEFVHAFMVGNWAGFSLHLLVAILFGITGVAMLVKPVISAEAHPSHVGILFDWRALSIHFRHVDSFSWLGLACPKRGCCLDSRWLASRTVAGFGSLGHRALHWDRPGILRLGLDRAGS